MIKRYSLICLGVLLYCNITSVFSQNTEIVGQIIDKENNEVLPYSTVEIFSLRKGSIANDSGCFSLSVPISSLKDTIVFSFLGYNKHKTVLNKLSSIDNNIIRLEKQSYVLEEVIIIPKSISVRKLGIVKKKNKGNWHLGNQGDQHAILIKNPFDKTGSLKNVNFYITEKGFSSAPFRVRIYSYDSLKKEPSGDLLNESLIVSFDKETKGWFTVDVSKYNIEFPKDGLFVAMEWIFTNEDYYYFTSMKTKSGETEDVSCYGQTIGLTTKQPEKLYWRRYLGTNWYHMPYANAMINAEVVFSGDLK